MVYVIYFQDLDAKYVNCQQIFDRTNSYQYAALCADEPQHVWTALTSQITSFFQFQMRNSEQKNTVKPWFK